MRGEGSVGKAGGRAVHGVSCVRAERFGGNRARVPEGSGTPPAIPAEDRSAGDAEPVDWSRVTAADLRRFFSLQFDAARGGTGEKIRPATAARTVSAIRTFLGFLVAHGEIGANPAVGIPAPRRAMRLPEFLPVDEMDAFLGNLPAGPSGEAGRRDPRASVFLRASRRGALLLRMRTSRSSHPPSASRGRGERSGSSPSEGRRLPRSGSTWPSGPPHTGGVPERAGRAAVRQPAGSVGKESGLGSPPGAWRGSSGSGSTRGSA